MPEAVSSQHPSPEQIQQTNYSKPTTNHPKKANPFPTGWLTDTCMRLKFKKKKRTQFLADHRSLEIYCGRPQVPPITHKTTLVRNNGPVRMHWLTQETLSQSWKTDQVKKLLPSQEAMPLFRNTALVKKNTGLVKKALSKRHWPGRTDLIKKHWPKQETLTIKKN